jgi:hypothetical protein
MILVWLTRAVVSRRSARAGPILGTASSRSSTFAVETHSGGLARICSMRASPSWSCCLSLARAIRISFALLSAVIRRSSWRDTVADKWNLPSRKLLGHDGLAVTASGTSSVLEAPGPSASSLMLAGPCLAGSGSLIAPF